MGYTVSAAIDLPGMVSGYFTDGRIRLHETLKARTELELLKLSKPEVSYSLDAADLSRVRISAHETLSLGDQVKVVDEDHAFAVSTFIVGIDRPLANPAQTKIQFETRWRDVGELIGIIAQAALSPSPPLAIKPENINLGLTPAEIIASEAAAPEDPEIPEHSMVKWTHEDDGTQIDGGAIYDGTIQQAFFAEVESSRLVEVPDGGGGVREEQRYRVKLLSADDKSDTGIRLDDCIVPDDTAPVIADGTKIQVERQADKDEENEHKALILTGGGGGSVTVVFFAHAHATDLTGFLPTYYGQFS